MCTLLIPPNGIDRVVFYFIEAVKEKRQKKKLSMETENSSGYQSCRFCKDVEDQFTNNGDFLCQAIENAGGVPYQLNFGQGLGDGYFLNAGYGIKHLFGVNNLELTERLFYSMIGEIIPLHEDISEDPVVTRRRIINGEIRRYKADLLIITPVGERKWIRDSSIPLVDDKTGKANGLIGIFFDITEQKQTIFKLGKAMDKATESDRLKTAFLNNLPHEIRTPLNAIVGFSTLLGEPGQKMEDRMEFRDIITHSSDHLLEIVDDVVEVSKIEAGIVRLIKKEVNISQMMQRVYDRFRPAAEEKNIILRYDAPVSGKETIVLTDGYKLFQTLSNLLSNAVKFTSEGKVEFGYSIKEDKIEFYVTDTGIGIGIEHQPNIFKPFYQAETSSTRRSEGTGLGLTIARAYVELLGGSIWFNSDPGEGSVFCFTIRDAI